MINSIVEPHVTDTFSGKSKIKKPVKKKHRINRKCRKRLRSGKKRGKQRHRVMNISADRYTDSFLYAVYHPEVKKREPASISKRESRASTKSSYVKVAKYHYVPCVFCGSPSMLNDSICRSCSSD